MKYVLDAEIIERLGRLPQQRHPLLATCKDAGTLTKAAKVG